MLHKTIDIWEKLNGPGGRFTDNYRLTLDTYILSGDKKRAVVLIFPGG